MAVSYKDIVITPNKSSSSDDPKIVFSGANTTSNTDITLRVYPESNGTLSFEGSAGQLFSITNDMTGSIFSVNDISGIPSIDVQANGHVSIAPYGGNVSIEGSNFFVDSVGNKVGIGTTTPAYKLDVSGTFHTTGSGEFNVIEGNTTRFYNTAGQSGSTAGEIVAPQVYQPTGGADAAMTFHIAGDYAVHFGLDGTTNDLFVGGWSMGATKYKVLHAGNWSTVVSGGATIGNQTSSGSTFYPVFTTTTSGSMSAANVATTKLYFVPSTGTLSATIFNSLSDITLKTDVKEIDGINLLNNVNPVSFKWKDTGNQSYGVIAQELEKTLPELVETNEQGLKSVSYIPMIAMLVDVVKKQQLEIEEIKSLLNTK